MKNTLTNDSDYEMIVGLKNLGVAVKTCSKCKVEKSKDDFFKDKYANNGLASCCKSCKNLSKSKWMRTNIERVRERERELYQINKESIAKRRAVNRKNNKEAHRASDRAYYKKTKDPAKYSKKSADRRAAQLNRTPNWLTPEDRKAIQDIYQLAADLTKIVGLKYHVDHIIPLQGKNVSGLHVPANLQILTASENCSKGNYYGEE